MIRLSARVSRGASPRTSTVLIARHLLAMAVGGCGGIVRRPHGTLGDEAAGLRVCYMSDLEGNYDYLLRFARFSRAFELRGPCGQPLSPLASSSDATKTSKSGEGGDGGGCGPSKTASRSSSATGTS